MIKLRVEWHQTCPNCGTELVLDFYDRQVSCLSCPWCGTLHPPSAECEDTKLRDYITTAIKEIEQKSNRSTAIEC